MDIAREQANWRQTQWLLAILEQCRTPEGMKSKFDPEKFNIPHREREAARKLLANPNYQVETDAQTEAARNERRAAQHRAFYKIHKLGERHK